MHEVSIVSNIFEIINENIKVHNLKKVSKVILKIGDMTCVEENAIRFSFEVFSKGTPVEKAELIIKKIKSSAFCENCSETFDVSFLNKICPKCNTFSSNVITGYELQIDELEGE